MFNGFLCAMLGAISVILKLKMEKKSDEGGSGGDSVLPSIVLSSVAYAALATLWPMALPHIESESEGRKAFLSMLIREVISTIFVIFSTGPIKVYLDVKRGKTSIEEMKDNYAEQRGWLH